MSKNNKNEVVVEKETYYWDWVPFLVFSFDEEFIKKNKGKLLNHQGNGKYNLDLKAKAIYAHYPSVDDTPTGYRFREIDVESDLYAFCGFGREEGGQEGFVSFRLDNYMLDAVAFNNTLPTPEVLKTAIRQDYYPGLNPKGNKWNEGLYCALMNFTKGKSPKLLVKGEYFKSLGGAIVTPENCLQWLLENAQKSLIARVMGVHYSKPTTTTTTTTTTDTTAAKKREVKPLDW